MKAPDRLSAVFFIALAITICLASLTLRPGTFQAPGPMIFPLLLGLGLFGSSIALFLTSRSSASSAPRRPRFSRGESRSVLAVAVIFSLFVLVFEPAGTVASVFLLMLLLMKLVAGKSIPKAAFYSAIVTAAIYLVFVVLLGVRLPRGMLDF